MAPLACISTSVHGHAAGMRPLLLVLALATAIAGCGNEPGSGAEQHGKPLTTGTHRGAERAP